MNEQEERIKKALNIADNGKASFCRIFTTFEGVFASDNKTIDLNKGRWVKVI